MTRTRRPSPSTLKILTGLSAAPEGLHGYALMKETSLASGTLYPILMRLTERGWLEKAWDMSEAGPPRRIYTLTAKGRTKLETLQSETRLKSASATGKLA